MDQQKYWKEDAFVGNKVQLAYASFERGEDTLLRCLDSVPEVKEKYARAFKTLTEVNKFFSIPEPSDVEIELGARTCEKFLVDYPQDFPDQRITKKMYTLSMVMPKQIREQ